MSVSPHILARRIVAQACIGSSFVRSIPTRRYLASVASSVPGSRLYSPETQEIVRHVHELLGQAGVSTERLGDDILAQACTHKSGVEPGSGTGHGEKMGFLGRRALRLHLTLFLSKALANQPAALAQFLSSSAVDSMLETKELGANVGRVWKLEKAMRWREVRGPSGEMTGLYKSRGAAVEALVGAVYSREGIAASDKLFREIILPHLVLPPGLERAISGTVVPPTPAPEAARNTVEP